MLYGKMILGEKNEESLSMACCASLASGFKASEMRFYGLYFDCTFSKAGISYKRKAIRVGRLRNP